MTGRWRVLACCAFVALTTACGSTPPSAPAATPAATLVAGTPSPTAAPQPTATPSLVGGVAVDDVCAFLAADVPKLRDQPQVGALARLAADLTDFYALQALPRPDGAAVDRATQQGCPAVRNAILLVVGQADLRSL